MPHLPHFKELISFGLCLDAKKSFANVRAYGGMAEPGLRRSIRNRVMQ